MKLVRRVLLAAVLALSFQLVSRAQQVTGVIRGTALDPSGAVVSSAVITVTQAETGFSRTAGTDSQGDFVLVELPVGHYRLAGEAPGFQPFVREVITLEINQSAFIPVHLTLGTGSSQVQVTADAPLIENSSSTLGKTVDQSTIQDLPLNGRHFTQLGTLQPGVVPITQGLSQAGGSLRDGQAYAVNGQRPESNNFLIDGADNFNNVDGGFVMEPPVDAIAEFRILTHTANAEFGHSTGSTTNIVTRSGSNSYHGSLWEFLRNDTLDAKSFFAKSVEPLKRNQYGGTFGGPVKPDKTFFFLYYEGLRERAGETVKTAVPSSAERSGDFSELCPEGFDSNGVCRNANPADGHQIYNVFVPPGENPEPLPFNQIPFVDPVSQNVLAFYPPPNSGNNSFVSTESKSTDNDQFGVRLDHYLTARDTLNVRYIFSQGNVVDPLSTSGANVPGFPVGEQHRAQNAVATETHTFSPNLVGLARLSFLRNRFFFDEHINHTDPASLGFQYTPTLAAAFGPPFIQVAGFASVGDPITGPRQSWDSDLGLNSSLTWIRGRHELKLGGGYSYDRLNALFGIATNGFFVFVPAPFTNSFANFLVGQPALFLQGGGDPSRNLRGHAVYFYAQDTWKLSSRFTLNYGLRYEIPFPYTDQKDRQNLWIPGRQSVVFPAAPVGLLYPGDPGVPRGLIQTDHKALAPRVGLAWEPTGGKWLVSSAYGIFYDPYYTGQGGPLQAPNSAPPYLQTPQRSFPSFADPFNGTNPFTGGFAQPMTLLTLDPNLSLPYAQDWNLNIQRAFGDSWLFAIGYVGTKGTHLPRFIEANPAVAIPGETTQDNANQRRLYSGCTIAAPSPCNYSSVGEIAGVANSTYHAMQTSLRKRFSQGFSMLGSYTLSKTLDDVSSFNITGSASQSSAGENDLAQNPFDLRAEHGRSMFDARHRLVLSYQWELPFFRNVQGWQGVVLGGWQVNGITTFQSGTPFTVYDSTGVSAQGGAPEISGFPSDRPNLIGDPKRGACPNGAHTGTPDCWYNPSAFEQLDPASQIGQFGNAGRNLVEGPGYQQWDFSALKNFRFSENKNLQFRAEFFNIFNHANFGIPLNDLNSPDNVKGSIQSSQSGRLVQLALKFLF
jgi:hypothetical protein